MGFLDGVAPPAEHGVENDKEANEEQHRIGDWKTEKRISSIEALHPANSAKRHDERSDRSGQRPGAGIDNVIVMVFLMCVGHVFFPDGHHFPPRTTMSEAILVL
jgi:hypothetical protein